MSKVVLTNARTFAGGADLTGASNRVELSCEYDEKRTTNYGSQGWHEVLGGLFDTGLDGGGQWEAGDPGAVDDAMWAAVNGRQALPWTVCPESANVGSLAWLTSALTRSYKHGGTVGDVAPWEASARGTAPLLRGRVAHPPGTPRTANGGGTWQNMGALSASQSLYAALHVLSVAGTTPSLTVAVESATDAAGTGSTVRRTFTAATSQGGQFAAVAGPVTHSWWRVSWTVTGTTPSFLFVAALGVA